jgi:hypothetical protein
MMNLFRPASVACALLAALTINGLAQQGAALRISGRVSPAVKLSLAYGGQAAGAGANAAEAQVQVNAYEEGNNLIVIALSAPGHKDQARIAIPIEVRTNVAYELLAASTASDGCAPAIAAHIESIRVSGTLAVKGAAERSVPTLSPAHLDTTPAMLLKGPRISQAGNFFTPTNALLVNLIVVLSEKPQTTCGWHAALRLSLRPAAGE